jgi:hypothetical protein
MAVLREPFLSLLGGEPKETFRRGLVIRMEVDGNGSDPLDSSRVVITQTERFSLTICSSIN